MATLTLTLADLPDGTVDIQSDPPLHDIVARLETAGGAPSSPAEAYLCACWVVIQQFERQAAEQQGVTLPDLFGRTMN